MLKSKFDMKKALQKYHLLNISVLFLALFFALPDVSAQMVRKRKINRKFRKCSDIGKVKVKKTKMSREMRQKLSARYANIDLSYRKITKKSGNKNDENKTIVNQESINKNTASELSIVNPELENGVQSTPILLQKKGNSTDSHLEIDVEENSEEPIVQKTESVEKKEIEEIPAEDFSIVKEEVEEKIIESKVTEKKKRVGNIWYTSDEAIAEDIPTLPFINDDDELSASDIEILKKAAAQLRYGFVLELQEHFSQDDIDSGANMPYKRCNRIKSYLVHKLGADANSIYIQSFFNNRKTDPKRIQIMIKN